MTHAEIDAWTKRMPATWVCDAATYAQSVSCEWHVRLHDPRELMHLMSWMRPAGYRNDHSAHIAGLVSIELAIIAAAWPLPLDAALGRGG